DQILAKKRWLGQEYTKRLQGTTGLQLPREELWARSVYWMYGVVISEETGMDAIEFARRLSERGIQTRPFFLGMHEQPVFKHRGWFRNESYPVAEHIARQGLYLPSGLALTEKQLNQVVQTVQEVLKR
ncbi:MAG: DegT/DnrJ/EryC1/StrS family aminotransferase, partial [Nitrospira sp.]|nr:DegT/DnrJ/EryC1/StrS family aminotransferase [Nitrospira sp.]